MDKETAFSGHGINLYVNRLMRIFYKTLEHIIKERILALKYMHLFRRGEKKPEKQMLVMMVDGRHYHGGMCDRFKGIVSSYAYCKQRGIDFRINYTYPFPLTDYLIPAEYDWTLREGDMSNCIWDSRIMYYRSEYGKRLLRLKTGKQIHYYGNTDFLELLNETGGTSYRWGELFKELFRPTELLSSNLNRLHESIGGPYNAAVFRFQNLLGDFPEYKFKPLETEEERRSLIEKCLNAIRDIISRHPDGMPLLVTSDSRSFLEKAAGIKEVFIIPGSLIHMDGGNNTDSQTKSASFLKSFLDFFMISEASHVSCIMTGKMYNTQFPAYAAKVNDVPFERIKIE